MAVSLSDYLNQPEPEKKSGAEEIANLLWVPGGAHDIESPAINHSAPSFEEFGLPKDVMPGQAFVALSKQLDNLKGRMTSAEIHHDSVNEDGKRIGLTRLIQEFSPQAPKAQAVHLPKDLVERHGGDANALTFGVKTVNTDEEKQRIAKDFATAQKYFGDKVEMQIIKDKKGNDVAVVVGIDAQEFNAVIAAERKKESLTQAVAIAHEKSGLGQTIQAQEKDKTPTLDMEKMAALAKSLPKAEQHDNATSPAYVTYQQPDKAKGGMSV